VSGVDVLVAGVVPRGDTGHLFWGGEAVVCVVVVVAVVGAALTVVVGLRSCVWLRG
jgi:hypothetical protein